MQLFAPLTSEATPALQRIEVASSFQLPGFHIIGLPAPEVSEARERIRAAMESCGFELPKRRVVLNLAPASIRKRGTGLDLAMALGILDLETSEPSSERVVAWGEVGLDGSVKAAGQITRSIYAAWQNGCERFILSSDELTSALQAVHWIQRAEFFSHPAPRLFPVSTLREAFLKLHEDSEGSSCEISSEAESASSDSHRTRSAEQRLLPLSPALQRTLCVSAIGGHHLLLLGPKGAGKSLALEWLVALRPESPFRTQVNRLLLSELVHGRGDLSSDSVRRVGSNVRAAALLGSTSGGWVRPGEFSLAHGGVLIADEFPEWPRDSREALREPLENGVVTMSRAKTSVELPARFLFAASGNLCPCGGWPAEFPIPLEFENNPSGIPKCRCTISQRKHYLARISGPILDRIDLVLLAGASSACSFKKSRSLKELDERVLRAREQTVRLWGGIPSLLSAKQLEDLLGKKPLWLQTLDQLKLSSLRARHKTLRVALSLSAWDGLAEPQPAHFTEASCYRPERFGLCG
jgi:magnesium chelatase family protein